MKTPIKRSVFSCITLLFFPFFVFGQAKQAIAHETEIVKIDSGSIGQTIEGWGSSLCWWAGQIGNWDESGMDRVIDLFTSPEGLNMNIFRYNIGGGDDPSHIDGHMVKGKGKRAEMEGFLASEKEPYNWNADKAQRKVMLKIKEKRPDVVFEAFSNSPPYWMTYSGCSAGHINPNQDNLKPAYYEAFCDYLITVCKHYKDNYGVEFKTLEPFNESTSSYWNYLGSQEGCHFSPETQIKIIRILYAKLQAAGLKTKLSASDETNLKSTIKVLNEYEKAGDIFEKLGQINTHTYSGTKEERKEVFRLVTATGKEFWQSETGPMGLPRAAKGLENNLLLAQKMFDDLNQMQPQAWIDWQLMEENNHEWGLLKCNFKTEEYQIIKNYYVRMQITRFVKQGYSILKTDHENVLVALNPQKNELVIALNNSSHRPEKFVLDLSDFPVLSIAELFRTSNSENCKNIAPSKIKNNQLEYLAPELSISTFIIK